MLPISFWAGNGILKRWDGRGLRDEKSGRRQWRTDERLFCILWGYQRMTAVFDASHGTFLLDHISLNDYWRTGGGNGGGKMSGNISKRWMEEPSKACWRTKKSGWEASRSEIKVRCTWEAGWCIFHSCVAATRLTEAKGRSAASEHCQPSPPLEWCFQHEPKPKEKRLTMFMRRLLAKDNFNTNTAGTINTSPISASQLAAI